MNVKMSRKAANVIRRLLTQPEAQGKMLRVMIESHHGNHAHYSLGFDTPTAHDEIVQTDKDIPVLLDSREELLNGVWIQYFYVPEETFHVSNPSKGNHGDH